VRMWIFVGFSLVAIPICLGCQRAAEPTYQPSQAVLDLPKELQAQVRDALVEQCGTPASPKLLGDAEADPAHLAYGAEIFAMRCQQCHGPTGDGQGPAAEYLKPLPRDYRRGIFKFISAPYGGKPLRNDLLRTVRDGVIGTSMPSFARLPDRDLEAVVDYVMVLTHRGELETLLAAEADNEGELSDDIVPDLVEVVLRTWREAPSNVIHPLTPMPAYTEETVELGRLAFLDTKLECIKCHGANGRGGSQLDVGNDQWGHKASAADLTAGMFRGGRRPIDLYRRILGGINGAPMPGRQNDLGQEPEKIWHLVHFVLNLGERRRLGMAAEVSQAAADTTTPEESPDNTAPAEN